MNLARKEKIYSTFNEKFMGIVALAIVPLFLADLLTVGAERIVFIAESVIVGVFVVEYAAKFAVAEKKSEFVRQGWEVLNLFIILSFLAGIIASLLLPIAAAPTTILRLSRLLRLALLVTRAAGALEFHRWLFKTGFYHVVAACLAVISIAFYGLLLVEPGVSSGLSRLAPKTPEGIVLGATVALTILILAAFTVSRIVESFKESDASFQALQEEVQKLKGDIMKRGQSS